MAITGSSTTILQNRHNIGYTQKGNEYKKSTRAQATCALALGGLSVSTGISTGEALVNKIFGMPEKTINVIDKINIPTSNKKVAITKKAIGIATTLATVALFGAIGKNIGEHIDNHTNKYRMINADGKAEAQEKKLDTNI